MPKLKSLVPQIEREELPLNEHAPEPVEDQDESLPAVEVEPEDEQRPDPIAEDYILKAQQDAQEGDLRARNRVILAYVSMLRRIVAGFKVSPDERQDLKQAGVEALILAFNTWKPGQVSKTGKQIRFVHHAKYAMRKAVTRELYRIRGYTTRGKQKAPIVRLDAPLPGDDSGRARDLPGSAPSPEHEVLRQQADDLWAQETRNYIAALPGREGELLRLRYVEGLTFEEIGKRFKQTASVTRWQLNNAKEKMRALLEPKLREMQLPESLTPEDAFGASTPKGPHAE
jgi:RNA polymerase sigma factor (sigma-70 family)